MPITDAYRVLKRRIVLAELAPGQPLQENDLAKEFGVSRTPIREALIRLEAEGLVRIVPKRGVYVSEVSLNKFKNIYEIRYYLIGLAGRLSAQRITEEELRKLDALVEKVRGESNVKKLQEYDLMFHDLLNQGTHNEELVETLERLRNQMPRIWTFTHAANEYFLKTREEIAQIVDALRARDADRTEQLLRQHISRYRQYVSGLP